MKTAIKFNKLNVGRFLTRLRESIYPWYCSICAVRCHTAAICEPCEVYLPWCASDKKCDVCGIALSSDTPHNLICGQCLKHPPYYDHLSAVFWYEAPIRNFITQYKYYNRWEYLTTLVKLCQQSFAVECSNALIISVPSHPLRVRQRGFNAISQLVNTMNKENAYVYSHNLVKRIKHTQTQTGKTKSQRKKNLRHAFAISDNTKLKHIDEVIIIDEVVTTGATVNELSRCLKYAGIKKVSVWAIARTKNKSAYVSS